MPIFFHNPFLFPFPLFIHFQHHHHHFHHFPQHHMGGTQYGFNQFGQMY
ncbi:MAG TPA: hypothetical protein VHS59_04985 [Bacillota bacterium]|nr:hypothetical protein [Bacillota bacterium]